MHREIQRLSRPQATAFSGASLAPSPRRVGSGSFGSQSGIPCRLRTWGAEMRPLSLLPLISAGPNFRTKGEQPFGAPGRTSTILPPPPLPRGVTTGAGVGGRRQQEGSPSTTPHRNLRAPPSAPATAAPPAPLGLSSPGAAAAGGSNDAPEAAAGLELSSLSRSSSAAWLSFCTILLPPAAATSAGPLRPPSVGPQARSPGEGLGSKRAPLGLLPLPLSPSPSPSAGARMPG